jgi:hypothetical protein
MDFGQVLEHLKSGGHASRSGWNGKDQWVCIIPGRDLARGLGTQEMIGFEFTDVLAMKTSQNTMVVGWLASQSDMLAEDWEVV